MRNTETHRERERESWNEGCAESITIFPRTIPSNSRQELGPFLGGD